jgi:hypothetical protein
MKIIFRLLTLVKCAQNIKNLNTPSCKNCVHFMPSRNNEFTYSLNKCNNFGSKDIISDEVSYDFASSCRRDEDKCGEKGKCFIQEKNIIFKVFKHSLLNTTPLFLLSFTLMLPFIIKNVMK